MNKKQSQEGPGGAKWRVGENGNIKEMERQKEADENNKAKKTRKGAASLEFPKAGGKSGLLILPLF